MCPILKAGAQTIAEIWRLPWSLLRYLRGHSAGGVRALPGIEAGNAIGNCGKGIADGRMGPALKAGP